MQTNSSRYRKPRADADLDILQWLVIAAMLVCLTTGLPHGADAPESYWIRPLADWFSDPDAALLHLITGLVLSAIGLLLVGRVLHARAVRWTPSGAGRQSPDGVLRGVVFVLLSAQGVTAIGLCTGVGGTVLVAHYTSAVLLIAVPLMYVLALFAHGHIAEVLRVLRPGPLVDAPPPPTLGEILHGSDARADACATGCPALLLTALAGICAVVLAVSFDLRSPDLHAQTAHVASTGQGR